MASSAYPSRRSAIGTVWFTILSRPPPTSFLYFTSEMSGSTPVVSQSIMNAIVPVGASTVTCAFLKPCRRPEASADAQLSRAAACRSAGTPSGDTASAAALCISITSRKLSRFSR